MLSDGMGLDTNPGVNFGVPLGEYQGTWESVAGRRPALRRCKASPLMEKSGSRF